MWRDLYGRALQGLHDTHVQAHHAVTELGVRVRQKQAYERTPIVPDESELLRRWGVWLGSKLGELESSGVDGRHQESLGVVEVVVVYSPTSVPILVACTCPILVARTLALFSAASSLPRVPSITCHDATRRDLARALRSDLASEGLLYSDPPSRLA